jgi:glycine dehydrogenase
MYSISLPGFSQLHPYAPTEQTQGYQQLFKDLEHVVRQGKKGKLFSRLGKCPV